MAQWLVKGDRIFYYHTGKEKPVTDAEWTRIEKLSRVERS